MKNRHASRGVALIVVLWIVVLLTVIAGAFIHTMRTDVNVVGNSVARARAEALADAAIHRALYELYKPANVDGRWTADGSTRDWQYRDIAVTLSMRSEAGRIDLNTANDVLLKGLFLANGVAEEEALALVDAVRDWTDADAFRRLRGAEAPEYTAAGLNYGPANAPFQAVEELKLVLGMTPELFQRVAPHLTVFSRQPGIDERIASREILRALPSVGDEEIEDYLSRRDLARVNRQPIPIFQKNVFRVQASDAIPARIRAEVVLADGTRFVREAVVRRYTDPKRPYAWLLWKESRDLDLPENDPAGTVSPVTSGNTPASTLGRIVSPSGNK